MRKTRPRYTDLVPSLSSFSDVVDVNERGAARNRLVLIKFYSKQCRACLRIATKYRRLAMDYEDEIDCYEVADMPETREIFARLGVTRVPSLQIFDGQGMTRLAKYSCDAKQWKKVDAKIRVAMLSMSKRRSLHLSLGENMVNGSYPSDVIELQEQAKASVAVP